MIDDRAAADGTQNVDFDSGIITTPSGFVKLSGTSAMDSRILAIGQYPEINNNTHLVAATRTKTYVHNPSAASWDEITSATLDATTQTPVSFASIAHQDNISSKFQHFIICDGGNSAIKKWSGIGASASELAGADGYNDSETEHRALQVCSYQNRLILISPQIETGGAWLPNPSMIRWPQQAKLQTWDGTGSGFVDLIDTGDTNVWAMLLGGTLIIYQTHSIWNLRYVGGTTVFTPDILIPDLGLLSHQLIASSGGTHYFVGHDYKIYAYTGGNSATEIGQAVADSFKADINKVAGYAGRMALSAGHKYLYIFIPVNNDTVATKAYKLNLETGAWTIRDFSHKYTSGGISAATLVGGGAYTVGKTYEQVDPETEIVLTETVTNTTWTVSGTTMTNASAKWKTAGVGLVEVGDIVDVLSGTGATVGRYSIKTVTSDTELVLNESIGSSPSAVSYKIYGVGDSYADVLEIEKRVLAETVTSTTWNAAGKVMTNASAKWKTAGTLVVAGCSVKVISGTNANVGYYSVSTVDSDTQITLATSIGSSPSSVTYEIYDSIYDSPSYDDVVDEVLTSDVLTIGDTDGYVLQEDDTVAADDGTEATHTYYSKEFDGGAPEVFKRVDGITIDAKGTSITIEYSLDGGTWTTCFSAVALTSEYKTYRRFVNRSCKKMQIRMTGTFSLRSWGILNAMPEDNR